MLRMLHDMTQFQIVATTTLVNPTDGLTVEVFPVARGYLVRMTDDDSGNIVGQRLFTNEPDALAYAHKIAGVDAWLRLGGIA
jgi:hypothetical protein